MSSESTQASERLLDELTDHIGGTVVLDRSPAELSRISSLLESHRGVVLLGAVVVVGKVYSQSSSQ